METESTPSSESKVTTQQDELAMLYGAGYASIAFVFIAFFVMGMVNSLFQSGAIWPDACLSGLKFGVSGLIGVAMIVATIRVLRLITVPAWLASAASMSVGFMTMFGLGEMLEGHWDQVLGKIGSGAVSGFCAGIGIYIAQKKGWGQKHMRRRQSGQPSESDNSSTQ